MDREKAKPKVKSLRRSKEYIEEFHLHGAKSTHKHPFVWDHSKEAIGPFCKDLDGNTFLDFTSHVSTNPLGYNQPDLKEALNEHDLKDPVKIAGQDFYVSGNFPGPTELQEKIIETTEGMDLDTVFLVNSGAEAVENGIKISYDYGGSKGVCFNRSFHGRTLGALTLTTSKDIYREKFPKIPGVKEIPFCTCREKYNGDCRCGAAEKAEERIKVIEDLSYVILEPIQGEGGYRIPSQEFLERVEEAARESGALLISDEIQAGMGRTGEFWAIENYGVDPDVITAAKGLRVGATISREEVFPEEKGRISSTWGAGDIISSFIGYKTIEIIQEENLMQNAVEKGEYLLKRLGEIESSKIVEVRGKGLMDAIEFKTKEQRNEVTERAFKEGLVLLGCGEKSIRILPPLNVKEREINLAVDILNDVIED